MSWSKVNKKTKKPLMWWYYKILCEFGWSFRNYNILGWIIYYKNLNKMCDKYKINLYGNEL